MTASPERPSARDCDELFAHALAITVAERSPRPSDADQATLATELRPAFVADCRAGTREDQRCGLAATTQAQLAACQATPSSSTSNSSVAPPGITPAAPRSP